MRPAVRQHERRRRAEYFSDGITEIPTVCRRFPLEVIARNTAFSFKGKSATSANSTHSASATFSKVVSAKRAARADNRQLIDGAGGTCVAERYDRELTDILQSRMNQSAIVAA